MAGPAVKLRRGESSEGLIRRFIRKTKKERWMDEVRDDVHGTTECRKTSKPSLKKKHKQEKAERRRLAEQRRKERRAKNRLMRMKKQHKKKSAVQKQRAAGKEKTFASKQTN